MPKIVPEAGFEARPDPEPANPQSHPSLRRIGTCLCTGGLTVSLSFGLLLTSGPLATADPPIPTLSDVQRAQQAAEQKATQVDDIEAQLGAAQTNLQTLQIAEDVAGQKYVAATLKLQQAKTTLIARQKSAVSARSAAHQAQGQVGEMDRSAMQGQAGLLAWAPIFSGGTPQQIIDQAGSFNSYSTVLKGRYQQLQQARTKAAAAESTALAASKVVQTATDQARVSKSAADTAAQSEQSAVNGYAQQRSSLIVQLAAAQRTSVAVAKQRQDGLEAQARARRIAAAKAAAAAEQRREQAAAKAAAAARAVAAQKAEAARAAAAKQVEAARVAAAKKAEAVQTAAAKQAEAARVAAAHRAAAAKAEATRRAESARAAARRKASAAAEAKAADRAAARSAARSATATKAKAARRAAEKRARAADRAAADSAKAAADSAKAAATTARAARTAKAQEKAANTAIARLSAKAVSFKAEPTRSTSSSHTTTQVKSNANKTSKHSSSRSSGATSSSGSNASSSSAGYSSRDAQAAIAFARRQLGKPYVFGATGPSTYDCSGLTLRSWEHGGREIPRLAASQYIAIQHISISQLRAGDLVFWGGSSPSSIYHVAIYIGGGQIIQAPRPGKSVEISGLYDWITPNYIGRV